MAVHFWDDEFRVNEPLIGTKDFSNNASAVLPDGRIVVVWGSSHEGGDGDPSGFGHGIRARILNPDGSPSGDEFVVNSTTVNEQYSASLAVLTDGRFVVTWISNDPGDGGTITSDPCVRARVFNGDGTAATYDGSSSDFVVNAAPGFYESNPTVAALQGGGFVIAFQGPVGENGFAAHDISTRRYTSTGPASETQDVVNVGNHNDAPALTLLADGRYVVAWHQGFADDGAPQEVAGGIKARIYLANGTPDPSVNGGAAFALDYHNISQQHSVDLTTLSDGRFVATWVTEDASDDGSSTAIRARVFLANGQPDPDVADGEDFLVNTTTMHDQRRPVVEATADGGFVISFWSRVDFEGNVEDTLLARVFDAGGEPLGNNFMLNEGPGISGGAYSGAPHSMSLTPDGRIFNFYHNEPGYEFLIGRFLDFNDIGKSQNGDGAPNTLFGTAFNDSLKGLNGGDALYAGGGSDTLDGGGGIDMMSGGSGNDTYFVDNAGDMVFETTGSDTVITSVSYVLKAGVSVEQLRTNLDTGTASIHLTGNAFAQTITGNAGANMLNDGTGAAADTLNGLAGNDVYVIHNSGAIVQEAAGKGSDTVLTSVSYALKAGVEVEALGTTSASGTGAINLTGNAFAQKITGNAGANTLNDGSGAAADTLSGLDGNDIYVIHNAGAVIVEAGGKGTDSVLSSVSFVLQNGISVETLGTTNAAGTGAIDLTGNSIGQTVRGNAGSNVIDGKGGADTLTGFGGKDFFVFSSAIGASSDTVTDFNVADDTIRLENAIFTKLATTGVLNSGLFRSNSTGTAVDGNDYVLYDNTDGKLYYDADGSGAGTKIHFATLTGAPAITNADFVVV